LSGYALIPFVILAVCFIIRMPIAFGMLISGIFYFLLSGQDVSKIVNIACGNMFSSFVMLAAPLFIFTANVMNSGKVTDQIFRFANALVGRWKGGAGHVNVLASLIFSGMTGSAIADASGLGLMEIEQMRKEGYDDGFSCAITAASATVGPIFPPSIPMIIYALLSGASIGNLFLGGMVPGILLAMILMIYVAVVSHLRNYPQGGKYTFKEFFRHTLEAFPALLTPVILLGGIYGGVITPTEAGAVAALYALVISALVYRNIGLPELWRILKDTAAMTGILGIFIASSMLFSYIVALEQIPNFVAQAMLSLTDNKYVFLLIVNIVFLLLGMVMDVSTIQLVFVPIVIPLVKLLGIDLVHFGVVINLNMMIGLSTPPFGMLLFIIAGVSKTPLKKIVREILPMVAVMIGLLFLITYVPEIVMWLPHICGAK
jgi:tripartite ATP-independent transporter DctM subunit